MKNNISIHAFEKRCGLGNGTISGWKDSKPNLSSLEKVSREMNMPISKLLKGDEIKK